MKGYKEKASKKSVQQTAFRRYLTYQSSGDSIRNYLGIEVGGLREWLEEMFIDGMTWENYGKVWVVDHIVPLRMFDVFDEEELKICWHYKNLMPLLKEDNLKKEGNVHFSYNLLLSLKDRDFFYAKLFDRIKGEFDWMNNYIGVYNKKWNYKNN